MAAEEIARANGVPAVIEVSAVSQEYIEPSLVATHNCICDYAEINHVFITS